MNKLVKMMLLSLSVVVLAGCGGDTTAPSEGTSEQGADGLIDSKHPYADYFNGKQSKKTYNALAATAINKSLNYMAYSDGQVARHWANFVDGLLLQNEFGVLEKNLASAARTANDYKDFEFDVTPGIPWVTYEGKQYNATIDGKAVPQFVSAEDFRTSAREVLRFQNKSQTSYLLTNFIQGAMEYHQCTYLDYMIQTSPRQYGKYKDPKQFAKKLGELVEAATGRRTTIQPSEIGDIRAFKAVGIKVVEEPGENGGGTIKYTMKQSAFYFPTLLTYSCYLPVNKYFFREVKWPEFGKSKDKLLYCGPYILEESSDIRIRYKANPEYHNKKNVFVDQINYQILGLDSEPSTIRQQYEQGLIDGFGLSTDDQEGWTKYIVGPDGTGTITAPYSGEVNSRSYDYIDFVYGMNLNVNRLDNVEISGEPYDKDDESKAVTGAPAENVAGSPEQIRNAQKALKLQPVRQLILKSLDIGIYSKRYQLHDTLDGQYSINTYVPKGFVSDQYGKDYTTTHYYQAYADWTKKETGVEMSLDQVHEKLKQGQYKGVNMSNDELAPLRERALKAIELYNASTTEVSEKITLPVQLEYFSAWAFEGELKKWDSQLITSMNERLNNMATPKDGFTRDTAGLSFLVIPTYDVNAQDMELWSNQGNFDICTQWGWGPDYGDPMSYLNTFTKRGDWNNVFRYINNDHIDDYRLDKAGKKLTKTDLLQDYTTLVMEANAEYQSVNKRYAKFAQAECMLLNELAIYQPLTMTGQGVNVTVSKAAGYLSPTGSYGLAKDRQDGLIVLTETLQAVDETKVGDRKYCTKLYETKKADYLKKLQDEGKGTINIYD